MLTTRKIYFFMFIGVMLVTGNVFGVTTRFYFPNLTFKGDRNN